MNVLVIGATGSIGRLVAKEALHQGHTVRALVRDASKARRLLPQVELIVGDLTQPASLAKATEAIDAIIFTHGADGGKAASESVDYGGVRNILIALGSKEARIALMTAIGVTNRSGSYNRETEIHDWKRRGERLVRASGHPYTIVRPGWFDYNQPDQHRLVLLQGDRRQAGDSSDGVVARQQIAEILVRSLSADQALRKTFELVAEDGPAQDNFDPLFARLDADPANALDGVRDMANQPLEDEPERVRADLNAIKALRACNPQ